MKPELLEILCCPVTRQGLRMADEAELKRINEMILAGALLRGDGGLVTEKLAAALVTRDQLRAYPVRDGLPVLLASQGFRLRGEA